MEVRCLYSIIIILIRSFSKTLLSPIDKSKMSQSISRFPKTFKALLKVPNKQMPPALGIYRFLNKEEKYDENNILKESMVSINNVSMILYTY